MTSYYRTDDGRMFVMNQNKASTNLESDLKRAFEDESCTNAMQVVFPVAITIYLFVFLIAACILAALINFSGILPFKLNIKETFFYAMVIFLVWNVLFTRTGFGMNILCACILAVVIQYFMYKRRNK